MRCRRRSHAGLLRTSPNGHVAVPRSAWLAATETQAEVELGEQDDVGPDALGELERFASSASAEHVEAVVAQLATEIFASLGFGLGDEDGARHEADASPASRGAPDVLCSGCVPSLPQLSAEDVARKTAM